MNFTLTIKPDEIYYKEAYNEIISSYKFKKYEPLFATIMILLGLFLYNYDSNNRLGLFPIVFCAIGIYEFIKFFKERKKWIEIRLDSKIAGQVIELEFSVFSIKHKGPFSNGELLWNGLKEIIRTKNGILLKPENGISIYLPTKLFTNNDQIDFILSHKTDKN
jgi:hypothetical protein